MEGSSLPSPKFSSPTEGESQDFLGFSSTPIPGKNFKPKWGKKNRTQNWNRFGSFNEGPSPGQEPAQNHHNSPHPNNQYQNSQHHGNQHQNSPHGNHHQNSPHVNNHHHQNSPHHRGHFHMRGSPHQYTPRGRGNYQNTPNGGRGNYQNTPNGGRGNYQNTPNGGRGNYQNSFGGGRGSFNNSPNRGRGGFQNSPSGGQGGGYFSPAMLRNPWADLEWARDRKRENEAGGEGNEEGTVTEGNVEGTVTEGNVEESEENNEGDPSNNVMSDSMIPQVGESLLERNNDITSVDDDLVTEGGEKDERNKNEDL